MTEEACFADILTLNIALCFFTPKFIIIIFLPSYPATGDPLGILQLFLSFMSVKNFTTSVFTALLCLMLDSQQIYTVLKSFGGPVTRYTSEGFGQCYFHLQPNWNYATI